MSIDASCNLRLPSYRVARGVRFSLTSSIAKKPSINPFTQSTSGLMCQLHDVRANAYNTCLQQCISSETKIKYFLFTQIGLFRPIHMAGFPFGFNFCKHILCIPPASACLYSLIAYVQAVKSSWRSVIHQISGG